MKRTVLLAIATAALAILPALGDDSILGVTVGPEATFTSVSATTSLSKGGDTTFGNYGGTTSYTYKIRTTETGGTGSITVLVTSFGASGPAVADLSFTCTAPSSGTPCSSSTAAST